MEQHLEDIRVSCAAALGRGWMNCSISDLAGNAKKVGDYFAEKLKGLPHVKEVRHQGLLTGIEFDDTLNAVDIKHACFDRKLLVTAIGSSVYPYSSTIDRNRRRM